MSVSKSLHDLRDWIEKEICSKIELKVQKSPATADYAYELIHPKAWLMFEPPEDPRKPPSAIPQNPAILIQLVDGEERPIDRREQLNIRLHLIVWNPGRHSPDMFWADEDRSGIFHREDGRAFRPNMDGMEDAFNLLDTTLDTIKQTVNIGKLHIMQEEGIRFGHYQSADGIPNFYPYYLMWVDFSVMVVNPPTIHNTMGAQL